jgi:hypothetical protein
MTMAGLWRWSWLPALLAGCSGPAADDPACEGVSGGAVTRLVEHPGSGHEVTVRLRFQDGVPIGESDLVRCLSVRASSEQRAAPVVSARPVAAAYTLLLVDPGLGRRDSDVTRGLVDQLVRRRPATEAIAVYRWGAEVTQVAPFSTDRRILLDRLPVGLPPADAVAPVRSALSAAAGVLGAVGGTAADALRTIVLVTPRAAALAGFGEALPSAEPNLVVWIGAAEQASLVGDLPPGLRFGIPASTVPASVVASLSDRLDAYLRLGHYGIGLCGDDAQQTVDIAFRGGAGSGGDTTSTVTLPRPMPENRDGPCDPAALAGGRRAFPRRLELLFTPDQRAAAEAAHADPASHAAFDLQVRLNRDAAPTAATARYRSDASYGCERRSYTVELEGTAPRFLFPGFASRKLHLVAMCRDRLYLRTLTALALMSDEGLFPVPFDMVELVVDGVSRGPYVAFEDAPDSLRVHSSRVNAVVRRDMNGAATVPVVQFSATSAADAVASYQRILDTAGTLSGQRLEDALRDRFHFDRYLSWVALMNLMGSGGYADEIFFYSVETTAATGQRTDYHLMMGWDQPQIFAPCRSQGRDALVDPFGLIECSEAELDKRIFTDPLLYLRYADQLTALLERQPPERFAAFLDATATRLLGYFAEPDALAGLTELRALDPQATTRPEVARALLQAERELLVAQYTARREALLAGLARYRATR